MSDSERENEMSTNHDGATPSSSQDDSEQGTLNAEALQAALEEQKALAAEYLDNWRRTAADFDNYKKRQTKDRALYDERTKSTLVAELLPVMDDLDRALDFVPEQADETGWRGGVELVQRKLMTALSKLGIQEIEVEIGQLFNPEYHEAMFFETTDDYPENSILGVLRKGYRIGDRVLRPIMVKVSKPS